MLRHRLLQMGLVTGFFIILGVRCYAFTPPPPQKCSLCHGLDTVYLEYMDSGHSGATEFKDGVGCFNCHIPGKIQMKQLGVSRREMGFDVLGYLYNAAKEEGEEPVWKAVRLNAREVCLRCHGEDGAGHCKAAKMSDTACHECHMPDQGLTTYRVHKAKPIFMHNDVSNDVVHGANNIEKYVTREHRIHTWDAAAAK